MAFNGIRVRVFTDEADEDAFQVLRPNQTIQTEWDPAEVHDLSTGGLFDFRVRGSFPTADLNCTTITGSIPFDSILSSEVDGVAAADVHHSFQRMLRMKARRSDLGSDCTGTEGTAQTTALSNCAKLASAAATAASDGAAAKMTEYFGSSSASTRTTVANIFNKIATECGTTTGGVAALHCTDQYGYCGSSVLAYTIPEMNYEVSCPIYFSRLSALASRCHGQDQATTTLHETTHLNQIKGTQDYGYGYSVATQLTTQQALNNADNYALFANGELQCQEHSHGQLVANSS